MVGDSRTFSISASDPDGDPVSTTWLVDGAATGQTASSFVFAPVAAQVGAHVVEVVASDGTASGGATRRSWDVVVVRPDADHDGWTATPDCDESDPAVHPTANELLGNGIDDDCDSGTPDAPPGGLTGSMWSWGSNHNGTIGIGSFTPDDRRARPSRSRATTTSCRSAAATAPGYAVLASGEVRGVGLQRLGQPRQSAIVGRADEHARVAAAGRRRVRRPVRGDADLRRAAVTSSPGAVDGSVVSWGDNQGRQVGDGSTVNYRLFPVNVLTAGDTASR